MSRNYLRNNKIKHYHYQERPPVHYIASFSINFGWYLNWLWRVSLGFAHDGAWYTPAQRLINIQLQPRNQTSQAGIGLHFIAIVISESRRKKSYNKNLKLYLLVNLILKS